ncbi:MAG: PhnD/SsuA/transferrin family substrate-binding protein [Aquificaceae bacterium]|nr:PhnD/SsuA/transferrin family substrate-binding protein [Aquificaceae bacterium]
MKFFLLLITLFLFSSAQERIRFSPLPIKPKEELIAGYLPLVNLLENKTGYSFSLVYIERYDKLLQEFIKGNVDLAILGPLPYTLLKKEYAKAIPIAYVNEQDGKAHYTCVLVSSLNGPKRIEDINGPIALPQKISTCGYFSASIMLSTKGKDIKKLGYKFFETHNEAIEAVIRGEFQVASLKKSVAEKYRGFSINFISESPPWPAYIVVANSKTLSTERISRLRDILLSLKVEERSRLIEGRYGFSPIREEELKIIERYAEHIPK